MLWTLCTIMLSAIPYIANYINKGIIYAKTDDIALIISNISAITAADTLYNLYKKQHYGSIMNLIKLGLFLLHSTFVISGVVYYILLLCEKIESSNWNLRDSLLPVICITLANLITVLIIEEY